MEQGKGQMYKVGVKTLRGDIWDCSQTVGGKKLTNKKLESKNCSLPGREGSLPLGVRSSRGKILLEGDGDNNFGGRKSHKGFTMGGGGCRS